MTRVLVVEDDPFIAFDLSEQLAEAGFVIVGPALSAGKGLQLVEDEGCDLAVLDVNLGRETSEAVAVRLIERNVPFVTVTGYTSDQRPKVFASGPLLAKPVRIEHLVSILRGLPKPTEDPA